MFPHKTLPNGTYSSRGNLIFYIGKLAKLDSTIDHALGFMLMLYASGHEHR